MKKWIFILCLTPSSLWSQKLVHIPDTNFLKVLKVRGYTTRDSLDPKKTKGLLQMMIGYNNIQDLSGIEYFTQVWNLKLTGNEIRDLNHLPPKLTHLDCSRNKLTNIDSLPKFLKNLNCSYNNIKSISNLPPRLSVLNFQGNMLERLPKFPNSINYINYYKNPINPASLPEAYRLVNCNSVFQNCLPNSLIHWDILSNNFDFAELPDFNTVEINLKYNYSWGGGSMQEIMVFEREDGKFSGTKMTQRRIKDNLDTTKTISIDHHFNSSDLEKIIKRIKNEILEFNFQATNAQQKINLLDKYSKGSTISYSCDDCTYYSLRIKFRTESEDYVCSYNFNLPAPNSLNLRPTGELNFNLKELINWLYAYQLVDLIFPYDHQVKKVSFSPELLERVIKWNNK